MSKMRKSPTKYRWIPMATRQKQQDQYDRLRRQRWSKTGDTDAGR